MTIAALSVTPNSITSPSTFNTDMDTLLGELSTLISEMNTDIGQANTDASTATAQALIATAQALAATAAASVAVWVSGTSYVEGNGRYSPITFLSYRCISDVSGTTDPSADADHWRPLNPDNTVNNIGSTGGGTQDIDLAIGRLVNLTVDTSANTFTFSNPTASGTFDGFVLNVTNGGSQTVNYPSSVDFVAGAAPALTAAGIDTLVFLTWDGGTVWFCFVVGQAVA